MPYPASISGSNNFYRLTELCAELQLAAPYDFNELDLPILLGAEARNRRAELYDEILNQAELPSYWPDDIARHPSLVLNDFMESLRPFARRAARDAAAIAPDDPERSAEIGLALVMMGRDLQRNGLNVHLILGTSFESMGMKELIRVRSDLRPAAQRPDHCGTVKNGSRP